MRRAAVALIAALLVALAATAPAREPTAATRVERLGRSTEGRPIGVVRQGDPAAPRKVLVVGCVHGDECAGRAIVFALRAVEPPPGVELLTVLNLNPDGFRRRIRQNARGVDLNRNSSQGWRPLGPRGTRFHAGPRPFSEPEARAVRDLIRRERPAVTIWYHQPLALVDFPEAGVAALTHAYAARTGLPAVRLGARPGSLSRWQNARVRAGSSMVVELPAGTLAPPTRDAHAAAVLALAAAG